VEEIKLIQGKRKNKVDKKCLFVVVFVIEIGGILNIKTFANVDNIVTK